MSLEEEVPDQMQEVENFFEEEVLVLVDANNYLGDKQQGRNVLGSEDSY